MKQLTYIFLFFSLTTLGQSSWKKINTKNFSYRVSSKKIITKKHFPNNYNLYSIDLKHFNKNLHLRNRGTKHIIELPINGKLRKFSIHKTSYLAPDLAKKYPNINSYSGRCLTDSTITAKISVGLDGIHAVIFRPNKQTIFIDPYTVDRSTYIVYRKNKIRRRKFSCTTLENKYRQRKSVSNYSKNYNRKLQTYRLAIVCTNKYGEYHLKNQGIAENAPLETKKSAVISAINTLVTRINSIYERDLSIRLILVGNNDKIIHFDTSVDDNLSSNTNELLEQGQQLIDSKIGVSNYDIGHTITTDYGGIAMLNSVCYDGYKGQGVSGLSEQPDNDAFHVDVACHEIGHQFGATHSYGASNDDNCNTREPKTAAEPGSGSTIMSYAGICTKNVQMNSNDYFHVLNLEQIWNFTSLISCGKEIGTTNTAPTANAGQDYFVPKSTPLILRGAGTDSNDTNLTFCWEQIDTGKASTPPYSKDTEGPVFRSYLPTSSPNRYLPKLENLINKNSEWEVLPAVPRDLNFALTVRDNHPNGGAIAIDKMKITVVDAPPFKVLSQNTPEEWKVSTNQTIKWDVSNTFDNPINCKKVTIKLSVDGGKSFPIILAQDVPNTGSYVITVPDNITDTARIMVEASDNVFFNINEADFKIVENKDLKFYLTSNQPNKTVCTNTKEINYTVHASIKNSIVHFELENLPQGFTGEITPKQLNKSGDVTIKLSSNSTPIVGNYNFMIKGKSINLSRESTLNLTVIDNQLENVTILFPVNNSQTNTLPKFTWEALKNVNQYELIIAKDENFSDIVLSKKLNTNHYELSEKLALKTKYFWKVIASNSCNTNSSPIFNFTTTEHLYCKSEYLGEFSEYITNVKFKDINSASGDAKNNGYEDFTNQQTTLALNESQTIEIQANPAGNQSNCYVFIDWNQDYIFDKNTERYDLGNFIENGTTLLTKSIKVPENATLGKTRMRVVVEFYNDNFPSGNGACNEDHHSEYGETEDYTLIIKKTTNNTDNQNIKSNFIEDVKIVPNPVTENIIYFRSKYSVKNLNVFLYDINGRLVERHKINKNSAIKSIQIQKHQSGMYLLILESEGLYTTRKIILK